MSVSALKVSDHLSNTDLRTDHRHCGRSWPVFYVGTGSWGRTLHDRVGWLLSPDRSIPEHREDLGEQRRGDHLMVQSLNTLINSIHFAPSRQGFVSSVYSWGLCFTIPFIDKNQLIVRPLHCAITVSFMLSWWQQRHNDVFPRPLPPASNCFVLGTIRWPSYKWWCDITHHNSSHITSVSRDTLVTSVLCNIGTCYCKNFIKPPSPASPIY